MIVYIASDHAGFFLKEFVKKNLEKEGYVVKDFSAVEYDVMDDYPDFIYPCVKTFLKETSGNLQKGKCIIFGGSGTGEAICANRLKGIRAYVANSENLDLVKLARAHNNANVISFGARFVSENFAKDAVKTFFGTAFEGERHTKRVLKIDYEIN